MFLKPTKKYKIISLSPIHIHNPIKFPNPINTVLKTCDCEFLIAMKIFVGFKWKNLGRIQ